MQGHMQEALEALALTASVASLSLRGHAHLPHLCVQRLDDRPRALTQNACHGAGGGWEGFWREVWAQDSLDAKISALKGVRNT